MATAKQAQQTLTVTNPISDREGDQMYREFFGRGENKYGIYPPAWNPKYGRAPLLGVVYADNEFLAAKLAYDRGISPSQCLTPRVKLLGTSKKIAEAQPSA